MTGTYNIRPLSQFHQPKKSHKGIVFFLVILCVLGVYVAYAALRPLGGLKTTVSPPVISAQVRVNIPWPTSGQAAFGADGYGLLTAHQDTTPRPTASVAKAVAALAILQKKPLKPGDQGPDIQLTDKDVAIYNKYVAIDGAVVPVIASETISEYQALQAMMLPSANNIAETTAIWAFGSIEAYNQYANQMVKGLGMSHTTITDPSGFLPSTVSTASDLVRLGDAGLDNPVFADIVSQKTAIFPNYGTIENVNSFLGQDGIRGIKTGNTEEAGGCYLAAADVVIAGKTITVITAILGSTSRPQAMRDSLPIIRSAVSQFQDTKVVSSGEKLGMVTAPWGATSDIIADSTISVLAWSGSSLTPAVSAKNTSAPLPGDAQVGELQLRYAGKTYTSGLTTSDAIIKPDIWWRLKHPV